MVVPNTEPMDLNLIRSFVAVCEAGSVTAAAQTLNQPKSTISRHLARLEEILDKPLLDRSRTGVALTLEGKRLFEQSRDSIHFLTGLEGPSGRTSPAGHVRIAAPRYFARGPLSKIVRDFLATTPDASIECLSQSRLAEAPDDAVDILVSVGTQLNGANHVWSLGDVRAQLFAAPKLLGREPPPSVPSDVAAWPLLSSCGTIGVPERFSLHDGRGQSVTVAAKVRLKTNELNVLLDAARDGLGVVTLPEFVGKEEVEAGRLLPVLPDYWTDRFMVSMALLSGRRNPVACQFVDFAVSRYTRDRLDDLAGREGHDLTLRDKDATGGDLASV
jgi:DNA-binding transcriptional LysR family regulator